MPPLKKKRLAGLWKKQAGEKTVLEGRVSPKQILDALCDVGVRDVNGTTKITLTVWLNSEDEKRTAASPDASLVVSETWQKPTDPTEEETQLTATDIPF